MRTIVAVVFIAGSAALSGCAQKGTAEDFTWSAEVPKTVERGTEFTLTVRAKDGAGQPVDGVRYRYQILWTGGASNPLRHTGYTGEPEKIRARVVAGPATIVFTCLNRAGLDAKVLEAGFEVK